jgi:hypothetical protein
MHSPGSVQKLHALPVNDESVEGTSLRVPTGEALGIVVVGSNVGNDVEKGLTGTEPGILLGTILGDGVGMGDAA